MKRRGHRFSHKCPHCGHYARVRDSRRVTELCVEGIVECQNTRCGWRGTFNVGYVATLTPSLQPSNSVNLPLSRHARESLLAQLLPETN